MMLPRAQLHVAARNADTPKNHPRAGSTIADLRRCGVF
jgi:hypothetical protein